MIGVAFPQTLMCGLCFAFFDLPARAELTFIIFILCVMQLGPAWSSCPAVIWGWFLMADLGRLRATVVAVPIMLVDNVLEADPDGESRPRRRCW